MADSKMITLNEMFGIPDTVNEIMDIPVGDLVPYKRHEFRPSPKAKRDAILESIREFGILEPIIVREKKDVPYEMDGKYEILAGHQRTELGKLAGLQTIPAFVKEGLSEDEAYQIHSETNWPRWEEMAHSDRAAVLASHYNALKNRNVRKEVLDEINSYLQTLSTPVNSTAEEGLSPMATAGLRDVAEKYDLSKDTIARYIRVDTLTDGLKGMLDEEKLALRAAVELSYISTNNQDMLVEIIQEGGYKCDIQKAKMIRQLQQKGQLNEVTMTDVLSGKKTKKKPGKPKAFRVSNGIIQKYFKPEEKQKDIEDVIDKALELYFEQMAEEE